MHLDLNADVGESFGVYHLGDDVGLMPFITSANVACGFHAADPGVMRETIALARQHGVAVGAHPGFPDLAGFGRRNLDASPSEVRDLVLYQIGALAALAAAAGVHLQHVKPHGALFNMAALERRLADAIAGAIASFDRTLILFGPPASALTAAGAEAGLRTAAEGFADRAYGPDGRLVSRREAGAIIDDAEQVTARAVRMARQHEVVAIDGSVIPLQVDTLCLHGDTPGAAVRARRVREALEAAGVAVRPPGALEP